MKLRSLLFVPGDSDRKQARALASGADALILDLEDSVAPARLPLARDCVRSFLAGARDAGTPGRWVRVNPPSSPHLLPDLVAVVGGAPDGIVLPKISTAAEVVRVHHCLCALEAREGLRDGAIRLIVIATETAQAVLGTEPFVGIATRLAGLTWGHEDLAAALGASQRLEDDGSLGLTFRIARSVCLLRAAASQTIAIDGVYTDFRDAAGLAREAARARVDGFAGKLAIHPDQVPVINEAFTPTPEEVERARRIVAAFESEPGAGVLSFDGRMLDRPHLALARRVLASADE